MSDKQFEITARVTLRTTVTVDADTEEEALAKFEAMDWADDGFSGAEIIDWHNVSRPTKIYL